MTNRTHSLQVSVQRPRQVLRGERELDRGGPAQQQHDLPLHGNTVLKETMLLQENN